jgi:hypothetical protein
VRKTKINLIGSSAKRDLLILSKVNKVFDTYPGKRLTMYAIISKVAETLNYDISCHLQLHSYIMGIIRNSPQFEIRRGRNVGGVFRIQTNS